MLSEFIMPSRVPMSAFASDARENGLLRNALYARDNIICCCGSSAAASAGLIRKNAASDVDAAASRKEAYDSLDLWSTVKRCS